MEHSLQKGSLLEQGKTIAIPAHHIHIQAHERARHLREPLKLQPVFEEQAFKVNEHVVRDATIPRLRDLARKVPLLMVRVILIVQFSELTL